MASWAKEAVKPPWWEVGPWVAAIVTLSSPCTAGCPWVTSCAARGALVPRVAPCKAVTCRLKGNIISHADGEISITTKEIVPHRQSTRCSSSSPSRCCTGRLGSHHNQDAPPVPHRSPRHSHRTMKNHHSRRACQRGRLRTTTIQCLNISPGHTENTKSMR